MISIDVVQPMGGSVAVPLPGDHMIQAYEPSDH
jgi:hypothetical protein